jgi:hypothetical protein
MTSYRIIIDRFTYRRAGEGVATQSGIEYAIQAYDEQDRPQYRSDIRSSPDDFNVKLAEVMVRLERLCEPSASQDSAAQQTHPPGSENPPSQTPACPICGSENCFRMKGAKQ